MSIHNKLILPLINANLDLSDISAEAGFAGIYTMDINRPSLTNHVFLLYKKVATKQSWKTREKLSNLPNLYSKRSISINGVLYTLYSFTINAPIKAIKDNGHILLDKNYKIQISKFWDFMDSNINEYMFGTAYTGEMFKDTVVPEEDYSPKDFITYDEKREELVISSSL